MSVPTKGNRGFAESGLTLDHEACGPAGDSRMKRLRFGVAARLAAGLVTVALCAIGASAAALHGFRGLERDFEAIAQSRLPQMIELSRLAGLVDRLAAEVEAAAADRAPQPANENEPDTALRLEPIEAALRDLGRLGLPAEALARPDGEYAVLDEAVRHLERALARRHSASEAMAGLQEAMSALSRHIDAADGREVAEAGRVLALAGDALTTDDPAHLRELGRRAAALSAARPDRAPGGSAGPPPEPAALRLALEQLASPEAGVFVARQRLLDAEQSVRAALQQANRALDDIRTAVATMLTEVRATLEAQGQAYAASIGRSTWLLSLIGVISLSAALMVAWHIRHSLFVRLRALSQRMVRPAAGAALPATAAGQDEIGDLDRAFALFAGEADRREAELRTGKARLTAAMSALKYGVCLIDERQRIVLVNRRMIDLLDLQPDLVVPGTALTDLADFAARRGDFGPNGPERAVARFLDAVRVGRRIRREVMVATGRSLKINGCPTPRRGYLLTFADVTRAKQREASLRNAKEIAEEANRAKTRFLATMSHELRTPLNSILGFSEIIRDNVFGLAVGLKYREYAGDVHDSATHLLTLITDILDIAKIEAGKIEIEPAVVDLPEVMHEAIRLFRLRAEAKDITVRLDLPQSLPSLVADLRAVKQILANLLSNAVKFTPQHGQVMVRVLSGEGATIDIEVHDNGIGIPADKLRLIFQPFQRADNRYNRADGGTGLGLALVKSLTELHGGEVLIDSAVGVGTRVTVRLPLSAASGRLTAEMVERNRPKPPSLAAS